MALKKIDRLRKRFVNKFFVRFIAAGEYDAVFVTGVNYKDGRYHIDCHAIYTDESVVDIIKIKIRNTHYTMDFFINNFEGRGNKWAEGFIENIIDKLKAFGETLNDIIDKIESRD